MKQKKELNEIGIRFLKSLFIFIILLIYLVFAFYTGKFIFFDLQNIKINELVGYIGAITLGIMINFFLGAVLYGIFRWFKWLINGGKDDK